MIQWVRSKKIRFIATGLASVLSVLGVKLIALVYYHLDAGQTLPAIIAAVLSIIIFVVVFNYAGKKLSGNYLLWRCHLNDFPDVSGRWVGFLTSSYMKDGQNVVVPISLEIDGAGEDLRVKAYFEKGFSESTMAVIHPSDGKTKLVYTYDNSIRGKSDGVSSRDCGTVILNHILDKKKKRALIGVYYNSAMPQSNHGEIRVNYSGPGLLHQIGNMASKI